MPTDVTIAPNVDASLAPDERRLIEGLRLSPRRQFAGHVRGERVSRKKGLSLEFADYRDYIDGDDLRHLDWTVLARLDRATIRQYQDEDDLAVYVLIDVSRSMDFGDPTKHSHAIRIAAAMAYLGLVAQDSVRIVPVGVNVQPRSRPLRGRAAYNEAVSMLSALRPDADAGLASTITRFSRIAAYRAGMVLCVTDGLDPNLPTALRACGGRGHEVVVIQTLSPAEMDPDLEGDLRLLDVETGEPVEITANTEALRQYKNNLAIHCGAIKEACVRIEGHYLSCPVGRSLADFIGKELRRAGVAR